MATLVAPASNVSEALLREAAEHSLRAFLEPNAVFLAERLHAAYPSPSSRNLLATAYIRQGNYSLAADVLRPATTTPENRYLYAVCHVRIGSDTSLREAEAHLRDADGPIDVESPPITSTPGGASGLYLLASICQRMGRRDEAIALYRRAVGVNPMLWCAFDALAAMGIVSSAEDVIPAMTDAEALDRVHTQPPFVPGSVSTSVTNGSRNASHARAPYHQSSLVNASMFAGGPTPVPGAPRKTAVPRHGSRSMAATTTTGASLMSARVTPADEALYVTPSPMPSRLAPRAFGDAVTPINSLQNSTARPHTPRRLPRRSMSPGSLPPLRVGRRSRSVHFDDSSVRNPTELFATPPPQSTAHVNVTPPRGAPTSDNRAATHVPFTVPTDTVNMVRALGQIAAELGRFRCARAIELSNLLPPQHRNTGFVLSMRGRAFLDKGDYANAELEFLKALQLEPSRVDGVVEYYSTVLWQLKKERELAQLAIRAMKIHPVSSAAWCVAGNCYSLQRDADSAIKFFSRAISTGLVPNAYGYTLCGHEYLAKENFDQALNNYREALNIDERHYNALYGIGQVLMKQEKFALAQSHFRSAVQINPRNSILHYHLGVALASGISTMSTSESSRGNRQALVSALAELETAANLDANNPVPRFQRAKILTSMNRLADARKQLEDLRDSLPKEAEVHFELGRVCHRMRDHKNALQALSAAFDIDPKERKYKKALETLSNELESASGNRH